MKIVGEDIESKMGLLLVWYLILVARVTSKIHSDENGLHLQCNDDSMTFHLKINAAVNEDDVIVLRNNNTCQAVKRNETHFIVTVLFLGCGTSQEETEEDFIFKNTLIVRPQSAENVVIARREHMSREYEIHCTFKKHFQATVDTGDIQVTGDLCIPVCDNRTSKCYPTPGFGRDYQCHCKNGYTKQKGVIICVDYCVNNLDICDKSTTKCIPSPGIGPNYQCDCINEFGIKQGHNKCISPLHKDSAAKTDNETQTIVIIVVVVLLIIIVIISITVYMQHNRGNYALNEAACLVPSTPSAPPPPLTPASSLPKKEKPQETMVNFTGLDGTPKSPLTSVSSQVDFYGGLDTPGML